jgi:5-methylcytosine-specific restriction protein A
MSGFPLKVRAVIIERAAGRCEVCGEAKPGMQVHHRRPRGMGGSKRDCTNLASNGLYCCPDDHAWIESHREWAYAQGLLLRQGQKPTAWPVQLHRGLVLLSDSGGVVEVTN